VSKIPGDCILNPEDEHIAIVVSKFINCCQQSEKVWKEEIKKRVDEIEEKWTNDETGKASVMWASYVSLKKWMLGVVLVILSSSFITWFQLVSAEQNRKKLIVEVSDILKQQNIKSDFLNSR